MKVPYGHLDMKVWALSPSHAAMRNRANNSNISTLLGRVEPLSKRLHASLGLKVTDSLRDAVLLTSSTHAPGEPIFEQA
jgi:hypothetical protein